MSRTARFLSGVSMRFAHQALVMVVGLALTPFLLRHVGQHDLGLWLIGMQILGYLMLTDLGLFVMVPREVAYASGAAAEGSGGDLKQVVGRMWRLILYQTPLVLLGALLLWVFMPGEWQQFRGPIGLVVFSFSLFFPLRMFGAVLEGLQDIAFYGKVQMFAWGAGTAANIGFVLSGFGLYSLAFGWIVTQAITFTACGLRLWNRFPQALPGSLPDLPRAQAVHYLGRGGWITLSQLAQLMLNGTDLLFIGKLLGPALVVPYTCTGKLISVLANQPYLMMETAVPGLSELKAGASRERIAQVATALGQAMLFMSGAVCCVVLAVNAGFVKWWVGPSRYAGMALTVALLGNTLLRHWNLTMAYTNFCFRYERRMAIMAIVDGAVTVAGSYVLISYLGPIGAPLGSIIGVSLVSIPSNAITLTGEIRMPLSHLLKPLWPWFWRFVLLIGGIGYISSIWMPDTILGMAAAAIAVSAVYSAVMIGPLLRSPLSAYTRPLVAKARDAARRVLPRPSVTVSDEAGS